MALRKYQASILLIVLALALSTVVWLLSTAEDNHIILQNTGTATSTEYIPAITATPSPEPATSTPSSTNTALPTPTVTLTPSATSVSFDYPESFYITDITGHRQIYALGCEASNAVDWGNYFGVLIYEYDFQFSLPRSDNPDFGFVGDVNSSWGQIPPYAYGVHAGPVADLLVEHGLPAKAVKNYTLEEVKQKLSESKPIIAWVIGNMEYSKAVEFTDKEGRSVFVAPYEHVVILTGYNETTIRYMTNGRFIDTPTDVFLKSWGVLGNMAIIHGE